jgi:hypothetical protein
MEQMDDGSISIGVQRMQEFAYYQGKMEHGANPEPIVSTFPPPPRSFFEFKEKVSESGQNSIDTIKPPPFPLSSETVLDVFGKPLFVGFLRRRIQTIV